MSLLRRRLRSGTNVDSKILVYTFGMIYSHTHGIFYMNCPVLSFKCSHVFAMHGRRLKPDKVMDYAFVFISRECFVSSPLPNLLPQTVHLTG
jgi:hypothetical protein